MKKTKGCPWAAFQRVFKHETAFRRYFYGFCLSVPQEYSLGPKDLRQRAAQACQKEQRSAKPGRPDITHGGFFITAVFPSFGYFPERRGADQHHQTYYDQQDLDHGGRVLSFHLPIHSSSWPFPAEPAADLCTFIRLRQSGFGRFGRALLSLFSSIPS